jgi:hypothetical protein
MLLKFLNFTILTGNKLKTTRTDDDTIQQVT